MPDALYLLLTLAIFVALALLVGLLDRRAGASAPPPTDPSADATPGAERGRP